MVNRDKELPVSEFVDHVCGLTETRACRDVNPDDLKDLKPPYKTSIDFGMPMSDDQGGVEHSWTIHDEKNEFTERIIEPKQKAETE